MKKYTYLIPILFIFLSLTFYGQNLDYISPNSYNTNFLNHTNTFKAFSIEKTPTGSLFNNDGSKFYTIGKASDRINQFSLSVDYDISTATFEKSLKVNTQDNNPENFIFNDDGTKMFVLGNSNDTVFEYTLSIAYDIGTTTYTGTDNLDISAQDTIPTDIIFNDDGMKLFLVGRSSDSIYEYALSTAYDISTAGAPVSLDISSRETNPTGIAFDDDGDRLFIIGFSGDDINIYTLPTYSIATATWSSLESISSEDNSPQDIIFNDDGTRMYVTGNQGNDYIEYTLSTPYTPSTKALNDTQDAISIELNPEGITFNNNGSKMYMLGPTLDYIVEYNLASNFNISTASFNYAYDINSKDVSVQALAFNTDGTKLFIVGGSGDTVYEFDLSGAFDLSTLSDSGNSYSVALQDTSPEGIAFNLDGSKMFIIANDNDSVYQYTLNTGFDLSDTITHIDTFSVNSQESSPTGIAFNFDGTKMFISGTNGDEINLYNLSSPYDISSPSFVTNFNLKGEDTAPLNLAINNDGTKFFMSGSQNDAIYEYYITDLGNFNEDVGLNNGTIVSGTSLSLKLSGDTFVDLGSGGLTTGIGNQVILGNIPLGLTPVLTLSSGNTIATLSFTGTATSNNSLNNVTDITFTFNNSAFTSSTAASLGNAIGYSTNVGILFIDNENYYLIYIGPNSYNVENIEYSSSFSIAAQEINPQEIEFNNDGSKMYIMGSTGDDINQYDLSTNFDTSTATYNNSFSVGGQETNPNGLTFNNDGTKMFVVGITGIDVNEYNLLSPFDVSTAGYTQNFSVSSEETSPRDIYFNSDGTRMFLVGTNSDTVFQYNLGTGYDLSTASYSLNSYDVSSFETIPRSISFNHQGTSMFILGSSGDDINEFSLTGAFDISAPTFLRNYSFKGQETTSTGFTFNSNGTKIYVVGTVNDTVFEYNLISSFTEESSTNNGSLIASQSLEIYLVGGAFNDTDADNKLSIGGGSEEVDITNIPSGFTSSLDLSEGDTKATLSLSSSATLHADINDVSSLSFTFKDDAFSSISVSEVKNAIGYSSDIGVQFDFCPRNIRYIDADWVGGSGSGGRPNTTDDLKGVYVDDDVTLDAISDCFCLEVTSGNKFTLAATRNIEISDMLKLDGEIRLAGGSQLIQTHTGTNNRVGTGNLYIDQTSKTTDIYGISYLSSPVTTNGSLNYTVNGILKDGTTPTSSSSTPGSIDFVSGPDGDTGSPIEIASTWIYGYLNATDASGWVRKLETGTFNPGEGFSLKGPQGLQNYTFVGTPNDGEYSFTLSSSSLSLLGNPYPSALDSNDLFASNSALASLYFWEHKADNGDHDTNAYIGGYSVRNAGGGTAANTAITGTGGLGGHTYTSPDRYIPVGQGFFAEATPTGGTITINNTHRNYRALNNNSVFFRIKNEDEDDIYDVDEIDSDNIDDEPIDIDEVENNVEDPKDEIDPSIEIPMLKIGFEYQDNNSNHIHRQIGVTFKEGNSFNYDNGYESAIYDLGDADLYFKFSNSDSKYVITGIQKIQENIEIPLAVKVGNYETVKIMVDTVNFITNKKFVLVDKVKNTAQELSNSISINLTKNTTYEDRFFIKVENENTASTKTEILDKYNVKAFFNKENQEIVIINNQIEIKSVQLFNILGKEINSWKINKNSSQDIRLRINTASKRVTILKIKTEAGNVIKKILMN
ncbi:hypothetical protein OD91_0037 [Lutibacter sp. Hel_I_33_5]|uniref:hypothetical protein n=1 Tax=Lutibacter sp. Hel_I_33_5 TaxID=1566289 RepID=UPI0011A29CA8|nr:hypothetical protein [Lutibacter sp. Hel_I_33_5]TVZ54802.1 hypothetical protein OD91_0037 [Lutibacter sp. Hel_I_33_5]